MTEADLASVKQMSICQLENFVVCLKQAIERQDLYIKENEEWLRVAETEIMERSLGLT